MFATPAPALERRPRSVAGAVWLVLAVVLAHAWLLGRWADRAGPPGASIALAHGVAGAAPPVAPTARPRSVETLPPPAAQAVRRAPGPDAAAPTLPAAHKPRRVGPAPATAATPPADRAPIEPAAQPPHPPGPASMSAAGQPVQDGAVEPPPVYPTRLPPPILLHYTLRYNGQAGAAQLAWQHDGQRYRLQLSGQAAGRPVVEQTSSGGFDAAGLAPERFVDRRHGRTARAANFDRERGRIIFSGPAIEHPAWPGAQDRLAWVAQLAAIAGALEPAAVEGGVAPASGRAEATPPRQPPAAQLSAGAPESWPDEVRVFVVDARGAGEVWAFAVQGRETVQTPLGPLHALHLLRLPPGADALRVEAWLDPARGFWPARLRFTAPRSGDVFELLLAAEPGTPP